MNRRGFFGLLAAAVVAPAALWELVRRNGTSRVFPNPEKYVLGTDLASGVGEPTTYHLFSIDRASGEIQMVKTETREWSMPKLTATET